MTHGAVPELDGTWHLDEPTRHRDSRDAGRYLTLRPRAVLRPGSVADVQRIVRYCRQRRIPVAARGLGNTTHGQGLVDGVLIECRSLAAIRRIGPDEAEVGAGTTWLELTRAAHEYGLTPPALTGYLGLTVGGTLSLGGIPPAYQAGGQVDSVRALEVVTGTGELRRCSASRNRELFDAVLAGLGQYGIITAATVGLVPARRRVRGHSLPYSDRTTFFRDFRTLAERGEVSEIFGDWWRPGEYGQLQHLNAFTFHDPGSAPDDATLLRGLTARPDEVTDNDFLPHVCRIDDAVADLRAALDWDRRPKPWYACWLPAPTVERYVGEVVPALTPADVGDGGFVLLYAQRRAALTRPSLRLPRDGGEWVYLFTIMTAGPPDAGPHFAAGMLRRNRRLYERARQLGGVRYPIGSIPFTPDDWADHYGDRWPELVALKQRYDPDGILTPGPGVFTPPHPPPGT